ncbi:MAG: EI24 domain-containing protein [Rickettsiales bacterium]|jgi:CysZ protein|nr:EI24 domain-containing protein [Rickettsiales bacterium]
MFSSVHSTFNTLSKPYFLKIICLSVAVTLLALLLLVFIMAFVINQIAFFHMEWLDDLLIYAGTALSFAMSWFLFPIFMPLIALLFQENIANRIDEKEYASAPPSSLPLGAELCHAFRASLRALLLNILCLPLYLTGVLFPLVYYSLNGYLLGREFFELTAARYEGRRGAAALRRQHRLHIFIVGCTIMLLSTLPAINLLAPFIGTVWMVHVYWQITSKPQHRDNMVLSPPTSRIKE